jgi:hypothetical protein
MPFLYQVPQKSLSASGTLESAPAKYRLSHTEETVNQKFVYITQSQTLIYTDRALKGNQKQNTISEFT